MKLAVTALVLLFPLLAQGQQLEPPYQLDPGESPPATVPPPPTTDPAPVPSGGGWPAANGAGVGLNHPNCPTTNPPAYSGSTTITQDGTRIFNARITSTLTIKAHNVTIECVDLTASGASFGIRIGQSGAPANNTTIRYSRIHNVGVTSTRQGKCIYPTGNGKGAIIEYNEIFDCEDGIHSERSDVTIAWNWIHDMKTSGTEGVSGLHSDPITIAAGSNIAIRNNLLAPHPTLNVSSTIMVQPAGSCPVMGNIDIVENFIDSDGTGHTILSDRSAGCSCPTGMDILNNQFGSKVGTAVSNGSGQKACPPVTQRGGSCSGNRRFDGSLVGC
ncbi:MAG: hypothetical protein M5U32_16205 [Myxococcota bacterium]|nr:hypothetical protein [Myxococcota bacterium]